MKVNITSRVQDFLSGSQSYQDVQFGKAERGDSNEHPDDLSLMRKIRSAPVTRKDRRVTVDLTPDELDGLVRYVEAMREGAADNTWDADGRADLFAANSALAQIDRLR